MLTALDYAQGPTFEVAILTNPAHHDQSRFASVLWNHYQPGLVAAISPLPIPAGAPPLLRDRFLVDNQTTAYVCQNNACQNPVTSAEEMEKLLPSIDKSGAPKR